MTLDYDFLTSDPRVLEAGTWQSLEQAGAVVDPRKGDFDDPLAGVVHITFADGAEADVLLAKWKWEAEILERSEPLDLGGAVVPVPITSDLILLKHTRADSRAPLSREAAPRPLARGVTPENPRAVPRMRAATRRH